MPKKPKTIIVNCPECRAPAYFNCEAPVDEVDVKALIDIDGRACRYCGARLIPLREIIDRALTER